MPPFPDLLCHLRQSVICPSRKARSVTLLLKMADQQISEQTLKRSDQAGIAHLPLSEAQELILRLPQDTHTHLLDT
jgi:hypothetical protein